MDTPVSYDLSDGVATITMDDGKVNVISTTMESALNRALDRAEADGAAVVVTGRPGRFSAGFDLGTLSAGGGESAAMLSGGWALAARLVAFPTPVVAAVTGHAIGLGALLICACDYRIGAAGSYKITSNEVTLGIPLPLSAFALLRDRLHPSALSRAAVLAEVFSPDNAVETGWLDRVVPADELLSAAQEQARSLGALHRAAYYATKLLARQSTLDALSTGPAVVSLG
ncbi:MAG TPA: crotonase/enoyl-CoA hydratase family protein [Micromonosporaceae bacterium]